MGARVQGNYHSRLPEPIEVEGTVLEWGSKTYLMGIINVTPDSFSGDGVGVDVEAAVQQAREFIDAGADILDIGGESTRPGSQPVTTEEELRRVLPAVEAIAAQTDTPISIDTYKAEVAAAALDAGAHIVNDVWGLRMDPDMAPLVAERGVPVVVMHNRSRPRDAFQEKRLGGRYVGIEYEDLMADIIRELRESIDCACEAGVDPNQIIVDPGVGFGKTVEQNLVLIDQLGQLRSLGRPVLVGPSRKSFIGYTLGKPAGERLFGTAAVVALAIARGADIVRVHDVAVMADVARMADAIVRRKQSEGGH
ncbi:MAG: dihydropteroate synthase [Anaerolineae bacterium]